MRRKHKYADGGKVVKDHLDGPAQARMVASPGVGGAIKDFVGAIARAAAPRSVATRKPKVNNEVDEAT